MTDIEKGFCLSAVGIFAALMTGNRILICITGGIFCYYLFRLMRESMK